MEKELENFLREKFGINAHIVDMGNMFKLKKSPKPPKKICDLTPEEIVNMEVINAKVLATQKRFKEEVAKLNAEKDLWWLQVQKAHNTYAHPRVHVHNGALYEGLDKEAHEECR